MKNLSSPLLICLLMIVIFISGCTNLKEPTFISVPDENFYNYLLSKFDLNCDGQISVVEAQ